MKAFNEKATEIKEYTKKQEVKKRNSNLSLRLNFKLI